MKTSTATVNGKEMKYNNGMNESISDFKEVASGQCKGIEVNNMESVNNIPKLIKGINRVYSVQ